MAKPPTEPAVEHPPEPESDEETGQQLVESDRSDDRPSFIRHPISTLSWWWTQKPPNAAMTLFLGVLATLLTAGLTVGVGFLISLLVGAGNVPGYALAIAAGVGLGAGLLLTWRITRAFYEVLLRATRTEQQLDLQRVSDQLREARRMLQELQPDREALSRLGIYFDYINDLLETLLRGDVSLESLDGDAVQRHICVAPQALMRDAAGRDYYMSIWVEGTASRLVNRLHRIAERLPLGEEIPDRLLKFELVCAPDHTDIERGVFSVGVDESWLKWNHRVELRRQEERVYKVDKLPFVGLPGADLQAFEKQGYRSVRATSFRRGETTCYIVVLARRESAFSQVEERFLLSLRLALELDDVLGVTRTQ